MGAQGSTQLWTLGWETLGEPLCFLGQKMESTDKLASCRTDEHTPPGSSTLRCDSRETLTTHTRKQAGQQLQEPGALFIGYNHVNLKTM